ncbi:hypothetical protein [Sphingomonas arenae]|uniref:hypothetical protein n=1 Tax=Sphingomonas arenae TaxID=2812555 RepID=UPI0019689DF5|nr:hypothetical protein [Sphingomonas arenae]
MKKPAGGRADGDNLVGVVVVRSAHRQRHRAAEVMGRHQRQCAPLRGALEEKVAVITRLPHG